MLTMGHPDRIIRERLRQSLNRHIAPSPSIPITSKLRKRETKDEYCREVVLLKIMRRPAASPRTIER